MKRGIIYLALPFLCLALPLYGIQWNHFMMAMDRAQKEQRMIMAEFYAPWCGACTRLDRDVLSDIEIESIIDRDFIPVKMNVDSSERIQWQEKYYTAGEFLSLNRVNIIPTLVFIKGDGTIAAIITGFRDREGMKNLFDWIKTGSYEKGIPLDGYRAL